MNKKWLITKFEYQVTIREFAVSIIDLQLNVFLALTD